MFRYNKLVVIALIANQWLDCFSSNRLQSQLHEKMKKERTVRILSIQSPGYLVATETEKGVKFHGLFGNVLNVIGNKLNLSFLCIKSDKMVAGNKLENGSWTGFVGAIQKNEADLFPGQMGYLETEVVNYLMPFIFGEVKFIVKKPEQLSKIFIIVRPFEKEIWCFVFLIIPIAIIVLYLIMKYEWKWNKTIYPDVNRIAWFVITSFTGQGNDLVDGAGFITRCFISGWWLSVFVLIASYGGMLTSFMNNPGFETVPRTLQELEDGMRSEKYFAGTYKNTATVNNIMNAESGFMKTLRDHLRKYPENLRPIRGNVFPKDKKAFAFFSHDLYLSTFGPSYLISKDELYTVYQTFVVSKHLPYKEAMEKINQKLFESGILHQWEKKLAETWSHFTVTSEESVRSLNVYDVQDAFYILLLGYLAGILCLSLENCIRYRKFTFF
ncbi:probable glutamate receptor [Centruroides vittatus]|uniref:probable glutamate receptor n=1 Tax=Centruroides vittatus TaxID=120091 RepID=UPI00350F78E2